MAGSSVCLIISVANLVGFGAVVASLPAFEAVKAWVLGIEGGPVVSLAAATNSCRPHGLGIGWPDHCP
jgi:H+/gluconate symporter-like permease